MRQQAKRRHSRAQWQRTATERAADHRYLRQELARSRHERDRLHHAHRETQERVRQHDAQAPGRVVPHTVDRVWRALRLFVAGRISVRAVSRVLQLLAAGGALTTAPCPHTVSKGVMRLAIVRGDATRALRGLPVRAAPLRHGLLWRIARSLGLGTGTIVAVVACDAQHQALAPGAMALDRVRCLGVSVAQSWTGATSAALLRRRLAQLGRPAADRTAGGGALRTAVDFLEEEGLGSPCIDDIAHAVAGMLTRDSHDPPACETLAPLLPAVRRLHHARLPRSPRL
jgi:hypothetical protein